MVQFFLKPLPKFLECVLIFNFSNGNEFKEVGVGFGKELPYPAESVNEEHLKWVERQHHIHALT